MKKGDIVSWNGNNHIFRGNGILSGLALIENSKGDCYQVPKFECEVQNIELKFIYGEKKWLPFSDNDTFPTLLGNAAKKRFLAKSGKVRAFDPEYNGMVMAYIVADNYPKYIVGYKYWGGEKEGEDIIPRQKITLRI